MHTLLERYDQQAFLTKGACGPDAKRFPLQLPFHLQRSPTRSFTLSDTMMLKQQNAAIHQQQRRGAVALHPLPTAAAFSRQCASRVSGPQRKHHVARARGDEEEPDWDKEMSIFKQRTM